MTMKRMLIGAATGAVIVIGGIYAAVSQKHEVVAAAPKPSPPVSSYVQPSYTLLDSTAVFDLNAVRQVKPTPERLADAAHAYDIAVQDTTGNANAMLLAAMRIYPLGHMYSTYWYRTKHHQADNYSDADEREVALAQMVSTTQYLAGAKHALARQDSSAMLELLRQAMSADDSAYKVIDADAELRELDNYPGYYYMMDDYIQQDSARAYQSTLRTLRYTRPSQLPFMLTPAMVERRYEYRLDSATGTYTSPYTLRDDAMRDMVRGNRWGRFSRETDHSVQYVATLHLSDQFYTYLYSMHDWESMMDIEVMIDSAGRAVEPPIKPARKATDDFDNPSKFYIVNIDKYGNKIAEQQIGCNCSPVHQSQAYIDASGRIEVQQVDINWQRDPLVAGYEGNKVASRTIASHRYYQVTTDGAIREVSEAVAKR